MIYIVTDNHFIFFAMKSVLNDYDERVKHCTTIPGPEDGLDSSDIIFLHSIKECQKEKLDKISSSVIHLMDSPPKKFTTYNYNIIDLRIDVKSFRLKVGRFIKCRASRCEFRLKFTRREEFVLKKFLCGASRKQVSGELNISEKTVNSYQGTIMKKLGVSRMSEIFILKDFLNLKILKK